jgi:uncharacterized protein (DUF1697 family)
MPRVRLSSAAPRTAASGDDAVRLALLRGVNVGTKMVAMADLRRVAEEIGFRDVSTLINSGNLVYRSSGSTPAADTARLHDALAASLGVRSTIFVRTRAEVAVMLAECPLPAEAAEAPAKLLVTVWNERVTDHALSQFVQAAQGDERFVRTTSALWCWLPHGISASKSYEVAARRLGEHITARNWSTMNKLLARLNTLPPVITTSTA